METLFRYHAYDERRGGNIDSSIFIRMVEDAGYDIKYVGGINFNLFKTNCPEEECYEILDKLMEKINECV